MFGSVEQRVRPIRLAFLVDVNNETQVREAIRLSTTVWGGSYCPIVPLYKQMPKTWRSESHWLAQSPPRNQVSTTS